MVKKSQKSNLFIKINQVPTSLTLCVCLKNKKIIIQKIILIKYLINFKPKLYWVLIHSGKLLLRYAHFCLWLISWKIILIKLVKYLINYNPNYIGRMQSPAPFTYDSFHEVTCRTLCVDRKKWGWILCGHVTRCIAWNQGNFLKGIDKKTGKREGIEPIKRVFTYVSS